MIRDSTYLFAVVTSVSVLVPITLWTITHYRGGQVKDLFCLTFLLLVSACVDAFSFFGKASRVQSSVLLNIFFIVQFFLLSHLYYNFYLKEHLRLFVTTLAVFVTFAIINSVALQPINSFQNLTWTLSGALLILFSVGWKLHAIVTLPAKQINLYGPFWINTGILFYFTVNLFLFVMTNYVFTKMDTETGKIFWSFHNFNNLVKNILFAIGIYFFNKKFEDNKL